MMLVALNISTTGVPSGAGIPYLYRAPEVTPSFNGVHVLCVVFVDQCFFLLFFFGHFIVCLSIVTWWVSLVEQELLTLPEHLSSPSVFSEVRVARSLILCAVFVDHWVFFVLFLSTVVLSVFLWVTTSD